MDWINNMDHMRQAMQQQQNANDAFVKLMHVMLYWRKTFWKK